ncbi:hypothetical protein JCM9534A_27750 [Catenuloplanes indicus JCM 9534]
MITQGLVAACGERYYREQGEISRNFGRKAPGSLFTSRELAAWAGSCGPGARKEQPGQNRRASCRAGAAERKLRGASRRAAAAGPEPPSESCGARAAGPQLRGRSRRAKAAGREPPGRSCGAGAVGGVPPRSTGRPGREPRGSEM